MRTTLDRPRAASPAAPPASRRVSPSARGAARGGAAPARGAAALAAATPASRDRYVDFLRAFSIAVVVLGHWLMATVVWTPTGVRTGNALTVVRWLQPLTWLLQVMPVFFFVGGFAHLVTHDANRRRGGRYAQFVHGRTARLLRPVTVLLAVWVPLTLLLDASPLPPHVVRPVTRLVVQLLWFLGVYVLVVALAPATLAAHRRWGLRVLAVLAVAAAGIDLLAFGAGLRAAGWVNVLPVWLFAHQLGYFYADGSFARWGRRGALLLAAGGLAGLVGLTAFGPYPTSMVGMPGERISNMSPPTLCIVALTCWLVGLVMLARPAVTRWLARPRVWTAVVALNGVIMTVFLWHLPALLAAVLLLLPFGLFPQAAVGSLAWWALRPVWLAVVAAFLAVLVAVFGRLERPRPVAYAPVAGRTPVWRQAAAVAGVALVALGILGLAVAGLSEPATRSARMVVVAITPLSALAYLGTGAALLRRTV
ncbi:MAG TPA: acyltransferase [Mycobacteriales bacterium]|nr:acyltransferase [Mycobacteriales bacterium]